MRLRITRLPPSYLSNVDASESAPSTPEPNLSDPWSPWLSDAAHYSNSSDVVCISSGESDEPPPPKKKLTDFFKSAKTRTPAFPNALRQYDPQPGGAQKQVSATNVQQSVDHPTGSRQTLPRLSAPRSLCKCDSLELLSIW